MNSESERMSDRVWIDGTRSKLCKMNSRFAVFCGNSRKLFARVANPTLTASPQPATVTVEGPVLKMSPPTNDVSSAVVVPPNDLAPRVPASTKLAPSPTIKRTPNDYIFGKLIGEGSFAYVYLAKDIHSGREVAIKVCEKRKIIREKKMEYVNREKEVLNMLTSAKHSFVRLYCTFQDTSKLYFVLSYAKNGELLPYINKVGSFDIECTKFYSAEILSALEYLHGLGVIHRDLKPENILLDEGMHILITDFGSAKILNDNTGKSENEDDPAGQQEGQRLRRRNSFVGTAQYVSPEILDNSRLASRSCDLWALGCIVYQMVSGLPPFRNGGQYTIFQDIKAKNYEFPAGFDALAASLVDQLLVLDPSERLGARDEHGAGYPSIRAHPFFEGIDFETLHEQTPPQIYPYLPGTSEHEELRSHYRVPDHLTPGLDDKQLTRLLGMGLGMYEEELQPQTPAKSYPKRKNIASFSPDEFQSRLQIQREESKWHYFVNDEVILKSGFVNKRKGLFAKKRMLLLTTGPHLYYIDAENMVLKGEIPFLPELRVESKNFKIFFVHTPDRTYYLEDPAGFALEWCRAIEETRTHCFGIQKETTSSSPSSSSP